MCFVLHSVGSYFIETQQVKKAFGKAIYLEKQFRKAKICLLNFLIPILLSKDINFLKQKAEASIKFRLDDTEMFWKDNRPMGGLKASYEV